eukprot:CFRG1998T1
MKASFFSAPVALVTVAFILVLIGSWTRVWVAANSNTTPGAIVTSALYPSHYGLWVGCYNFVSDGTSFGCGYISGSCNTNLCLLVGNSLICANSEYYAIGNCAAYISARAFSVIAMFTMVAGIITLISGVKYGVADMISVVFMWVSLIFLAIVLGCFVGGSFNGTGDGPAVQYSIEDNYHLEWSFIVFAVGCGIMFFATLLTTGLWFLVRQHNATVD